MLSYTVFTEITQANLAGDFQISIDYSVHLFYLLLKFPISGHFSWLYLCSTLVNVWVELMCELQTIKKRMYNVKLHILCVAMYFRKTESTQASNAHGILHVFVDISSHDEVNTLLTCIYQRGTIGTVLRSLSKIMQIQDHFYCLFLGQPFKPKNTSIKSCLEYSSTFNPPDAVSG